MEEFEGSPALDAGLISAAQAVEHYEITRCGTLKARVKKLEMADGTKLLDETFAEEKQINELLTNVAEIAINAEAM